MITPFDHFETNQDNDVSFHGASSDDVITLGQATPPRAFGAHSTTDEVLAGIDLSGKRALVTGVSAGLGVETARTLAAHGANVVGTARDLAKAERALKEAGATNIELVQVDLADLASVRAGADQLLADGRPFDLIIANAGVMAIRSAIPQTGSKPSSAPTTWAISC